MERYELGQIVGQLALDAAADLTEQTSEPTPLAIIVSLVARDDDGETIIITHSRASE